MKQNENKGFQRHETNEFTGMPNAQPFPDFEPKQSAEKQVAQFKRSTESNADRKHTED